MAVVVHYARWCGAYNHAVATGRATRSGTQWLGFRVQGQGWGQGQGQLYVALSRGMYVCMYVCMHPKVMTDADKWAQVVEGDARHASLTASYPTTLLTHRDLSGTLLNGTLPASMGSLRLHELYVKRFVVTHLYYPIQLGTENSLSLVNRARM